MQPRFSWKLESGKNNTRQTAYRITVSNSEIMWDTGRVESEQSILVEYMGALFEARTAYTWTVTVWDNHGESCEASAQFETGLLSGAAFEGKARWITHGLDKEETASPVFTKSFTVSRPVAKARLYATALGLYEAEINGEKVDDTFFAPGWTSYHKRLQYQTCAVETLREGENSLRFTLGKGLYSGALGFTPTPNHYGDTTALLAMLIVTYADGTEDVIGTDESWTVSTGAIRFSEIYDGETQTAMTLALHFGLVEETNRAAIAARLEQNIAAHKTHLTTGFIGTPYLCLALSDNGKHALAGKLLLQEENPGWLYEVKMGATTVWERWNSILPDGSFNPANMNSLNHYAYGAIGNWLYTRLCGLKRLEPGYKRFAVAPGFIKGIPHAELHYESVYGRIETAWRCENGTITVDLTVPANTEAELHLPEKDEVLTLGSGVYHYAYPTETRLEQDRYTMETLLRVMLEHPAAQPIIRQYMPQMLDNPMIEYVKGEPISALLAYFPDAKPLYELILKAMNDSGI